MDRAERPARTDQIGSSFVAPAPERPTLLEQYLATLNLNPMYRAKAQSALETQVRANGGEFLYRYQLMERRVEAGARVEDHCGEMVLMNPDGSWMDQRNSTKHGLNYAAWLTGISGQASRAKA